MQQGTAPVPPVRRSLGLMLFRLVALAFTLLGAWVIHTSTELVYYTPVGPGPGFFPFWLGSFLVVLCLAILGTSFLGQVPFFPADLLPRGAPARQMAVTFTAIAVFALLLERLGFVLVIFAVLLVLQLVNGVRLFPTAFLVALGGSLGVGYAFSEWLGVFLPGAPYGLLVAIGL